MLKEITSEDLVEKVCYTCNKTLFWFIFLGHERYVTLRGGCLKCDETKTGSGWVSLEGYRYKVWLSFQSRAIIRVPGSD